MSAPSCLNGLRAFEAAARHLSFRKAAEELGVTPTAVSHAIEGLEAQCGARLFRRRPRPVALTREGAALFPAVRDGFEAMRQAVDGLRAAAAGRLRVTTTNAFAARWLLPRLPGWRQAHPGLRLEVIGTDAVLDLAAGEADLAIRYARTVPAGAELETVTLAEDAFLVVASPGLLRGRPLPLSPTALAELPLIEAAWPATDTEAPTWHRWEAMARRHTPAVPSLSGRVVLSFAEELHAIEAAIAGQGAAICSDILVGAELAEGRLLPVSDVRLQGYGFHGVFRRNAAGAPSARLFLRWLADLIRAAPAQVRGGPATG